MGPAALVLAGLITGSCVTPLARSDAGAPSDARPLDAAFDGPLDGASDHGASDAAPADAGVTRPARLARSENLGCADPGLEWDGERYYAVCTARDTRYYTSTDLVTWQGHDMAIDFPAWADPDGGVWGYELERIGGRWYLYFSAPDRTNPAASGFHRSVGVVTAAAIAPGVRFVSPPTLVDAPLVRREGHSLIDPFVLADPAGGLFVYYNQYDPTKTDSGVYVNRLSDPITKECCATGVMGASAADTPTPRARAWTGTTVEAPAVFVQDGTYYLLFSGNLYSGARYGTGIARAASPLGPFVEGPSDPILGCDDMVARFGGSCLMGPGGATVAGDGALVFAARMSSESGRWLYAGALTAAGAGWPTIE